VFATSLYPLGGILAVLYLGWAIDRFGAHRSLAMHFAAGIAFISLIALVALPYVALLAVVLLAGTTVLGSQTGLNGACGKLYPARMRVTGYGFATGVGRLGGIAAAPLGGYLLALGLPPPYVFLSACVFAAIAAVATALLALPARQLGTIPGVEETAWRAPRQCPSLCPAPAASTYSREQYGQITDCSSM
jgi:MFS family permease